MLDLRSSSLVNRVQVNLFRKIYFLGMYDFLRNLYSSVAKEKLLFNKQKNIVIRTDKKLLVQK